MTFKDTFRGDNAALLESIAALIGLARERSLVPPVPAMPLGMLESAAARIETLEAALEATRVVVVAYADWTPKGDDTCALRAVIPTIETALRR